MTVSYQDVADAALVLQHGTEASHASRAVVKGLSKVSPYSLERSVIEVAEFRNDASRQFAGGAKILPMSVGGNFVKGDTLGQTQLKKYYKDKTSFTDARLYLDAGTVLEYDATFIAPDLANDPSPNGWQVSKVQVGEADMNSVVPVTFELLMNGQPAIFDTHYKASMAITKGTGSTEDTITDAATGFVTAGFVAGQTIILENTLAGANENLQFLIKAVAAGILTLTSIGSTTAVTPAAIFIIHGGRL